MNSNPIERKTPSGAIESCRIQDLRTNDLFRFTDGLGKNVWRIATGDAFFGPTVIEPEYEVWGIGSRLLNPTDS